MAIREFFVYTVSDPAPFFGDTDTSYVKAKDAKDAMVKVRAKYDHPAGLHGAHIYENADAFHKGRKALISYQHKCPFKGV